MLTQECIEVTLGSIEMVVHTQETNRALHVGLVLLYLSLRSRPLSTLRSSTNFTR